MSDVETPGRPKGSPVTTHVHRAEASSPEASADRAERRALEHATETAASLATDAPAPLDLPYLGPELDFE